MSLFTSQVSGHLFALAPLPLFFQLMLRPRPLPLFVLSLRCGLFRAPHPLSFCRQTHALLLPPSAVTVREVRERLPKLLQWVRPGAWKVRATTTAGICG